ncbi:MAG: c-type cytochrome [Burkholderiales bacterium]
MSEHEPFIKTPRQLITVVVLAFVVPILLIVLLATYVGSGKRTAAGSTALTPEAIEARIRPVAGFQLASAGGAKALRPAEEVYKAQCGACHEVGAAGAPKLGDTAAWAPRIKTGYEALLGSALKGKGAMAAQAGGEYSDAEIGRAVAYMANKSGGKFEEPKAAADAAPAPASAAPAAPAPAAAAPAAAAPAVAAAATAAAVTAQAAAPAADAGKKLYETACQACHAAGVAGAPKLGDKAAWAPRLAAGVDGLTASVIKGKGAMPPKGGSAASDAEIKASVQYMVSAAK